MTDNIANKVSKVAYKVSSFIIKDYANNIVEDIKLAIMDEYDRELLDTVTDRESKSNPNLYREDFKDRLDKFEYIHIKGNGGFTLNIPTVDTFDFSGRLSVIKRIMMGTAGKYVELSSEDYLSVFNKKPVNEEAVDEYVPPQDKIYLVRYTSKIVKAEKTLNKKFVVFPFSNTAPIDIFDSTQKYVDRNINRWVGDIKDLVNKHVKRSYKGAIF